MQYLVKCSDGDYDGSYDWPYGIFSTLEEAMLFVDLIHAGMFDKVPGVIDKRYNCEIIEVLEDGGLDPNAIVEYYPVNALALELSLRRL